MKQFTGKQNSAVLFLTKNVYRARKSKNFQRNCLFAFSFKSFQLFESNVISHFLFLLHQPGINIAHMPLGITEKSGPEYWPITGRVINV